MNGVSLLVETNGYKECEGGSINKGMGGKDEGEGLKGEINIEKKGLKNGVEEIEIDMDAEIGDRSLTELIEIVTSSVKLTNNFDDSVVMDSLLIYQNSSSIKHYVRDFMHVKNKAEFIFMREFDDDLLAFCFVQGLKEKTRETLESWAPRTLQEAVTLANFQESLLEESFLVDNIVMNSNEGLKDFNLQVETLIDSNECVKKFVYGNSQR